MPRISSRRSEASEVEVDGIAEQELARLQQEYRVMEGDRKAYSEESQNIIRKQREAIEALQAENEELMKENRLAGSQQNQTNDGKNIDKLTALLAEESELKQQVKSVKEEISTKEQGIQSMEKRIAQQRKCMGGLYTSQVGGRVQYFSQMFACSQKYKFRSYFAAIYTRFMDVFILSIIGHVHHGM